jgi:hypothetical protein
MKQQRIERNKSNKAPEIIDNRQPKVPELPAVSPDVANLPLRTVFYVEVKDMEPAQVQYLVQEINKVYAESRGGIHYVIPIRHGKISSDLEFEGEILATIRRICEVKDGQIVLRGDVAECQIIREQL